MASLNVIITLCAASQIFDVCTMYPRLFSFDRGRVLTPDGFTQSIEKSIEAAITLKLNLTTHHFVKHNNITYVVFQLPS